MVLTEDENFTICFEALRDPTLSKDNVARIVCDRAFKAIIVAMSKQSGGMIDTQEIYDDVVGCFNYYNDFVIEKNISAPLINDDYFIWLAEAMNMALEVMSNE